MPAGTIPTGMPVPASSAHTSRTVPSPPQTSTMSAPATAASAAIPVPGSSMVVRCHVGSDQPASRAIVETVWRKAPSSSTLIGFSTTARQRWVGSASGSGSDFTAWLRGSGE